MAIFRILARETSYKVLNIEADSIEEIYENLWEFDCDSYKELDGAYEWDIESIKPAEDWQIATAPVINLKEELKA
jgi:hypothetical protein